MTDSVDKITQDIKELVEKLGVSAWKAGILILGKGATIDQISNLLSRQWEIDKEILKNAMNRVKRP